VGSETSGAQAVRPRSGRARRDELRALLDDAASVLGVGPIRLRQTWEVQENGETLNDEVRAWPDDVYVLGQRLRLRLGAQDTVVTRYNEVRERLLEAGQLAADAEEQGRENAVLRFETARDEFLAAAQAKLDAPIPDKEQG